MPKFETSRRVPFTARQMFDVVADVERYPQFLPLCEGLVVHSREQHGAETMLAATKSRVAFLRRTRFLWVHQANRDGSIQLGFLLPRQVRSPRLPLYFWR